MRKLFLLLLAMLFVAVGTASAETTPSGKWSDNADNDWTYSGTELTISTAAQLAQLAVLVNNGTESFAGRTIRLTADIDLSAHYWVPIGWREARAFAGTFDGEGHTVSGVCFDAVSFYNASNVFCGIFGVNAANGTVRNVYVANSSFEAVYNVGGVVAYNKGTVENCFVGSDVIVRSTEAAESNKAMRFAGIVASNTGTVRGCVSHANLSDHVDKNRPFVGGIVGHNFGRVENCVYLGNAETLGYKANDAYADTKNNRLGPVVGYSVDAGSYHASYGDNYFTQSAELFVSLDGVKAHASQAYTIYTNTEGITLSFETPTHGVVLDGKCYVPAGQVVEFRVVPDDFFMGVTSVTANGSTLTATDRKYSVTVGSADILVTVTLGGSGTIGSGTSTDPFIIKSAAHWNAIATALSDGNENLNKVYVTFFRLDADITVSTMMGTEGHPFESNFDGDGHMLTVDYNVTAGSSNDYCAPFRYINNATIKNLVISGTIQDAAPCNISALAGFATGTNTITNCVVDRQFRFASSSQSRYSGILHTTNGKVTIKGCVFAGSLTVSGSNPDFYGILCSSQTGNATIEHCLFDPASFPNGSVSGSSIFNKSGSSSNYYMRGITSTGMTIYGNQAYIVAGADDLGTTVEDYGMVKAYEHGVCFDGLYYTSINPDPDNENLLLLPNATDCHRILQHYHGQQKTVVLSNRTLYKDGHWNTLCLPFDMTAEQLTAAKTTQAHPLYGATVREVDVDGWYNENGERSDTYSNNNFCNQTGLEKAGDDKYDLYLYFKEATSIEAGKPYIVKWETIGEAINNPTFTSVTIDNQPNNVVENYDGSVLFVPIFAPTTLKSGTWENLYVSSNDALKYPSTSDYTLKSFRAYFLLYAGEGGATDPLSRSLDIISNIDDETVTGMGDAVRRNNQGDLDNKLFYDLQGRRMDGSRLKAGLYINNGKKVVVK